MNVSKKGSTPSQGRNAAGEKSGMQGMQGGEPRCKELRQLLEVERARVEEKDKGVERRKERRRKSSEAHNATSEGSMDEDRNGED